MKSLSRINNAVKNGLNRLIPSFAVIPLLALVFSNIAVYYGSRLLNSYLDRPYLYLTGNTDRFIPVIPEFAIIYLIAFPFWYVTYLLICRSDPYKCRATVIANIGAKIICGILFVLVPTSIIRPEIPDSGFSKALLGFIYTMDSPDNLFPSIHCFESIFCFLLIKDEPDVHRYIRISAFILSVLICLSTLFTKQHVIYDVFAGTGIAMVAYFMRRYLLSVVYANRVRVTRSFAA